ncbi:hypothetical protein MNV49_000544 [Pseudohyphozyma bogoriensis]|nr:hypothetical protein MNV49_000544 [Pseudohyphozyma bogoriensis]
MPVYNLPSYTNLTLVHPPPRSSSQPTTTTKHRPAPLNLTLTLAANGRPPPDSATSDTNRRKGRAGSPPAIRQSPHTGLWFPGRSTHRSPLSPRSPTALPSFFPPFSPPPSKRYIRPPPSNACTPVQHFSLPSFSSLTAGMSDESRDRLFEEMVEKNIERRLRDKIVRGRMGGEKAGLGVQGGRECLLVAAVGRRRGTRAREAFARQHDQPQSAPATRLHFRDPSIEYTPSTSPLRPDPPSSVLLARALGHRKAASSMGVGSRYYKRGGKEKGPSVDENGGLVGVGGGKMPSLESLRGFMMRRSLPKVVEAEEKRENGGGVVAPGEGYGDGGMTGTGRTRRNSKGNDVEVVVLLGRSGGREVEIVKIDEVRLPPTANSLSSPPPTPAKAPSLSRSQSAPSTPTTPRNSSTGKKRSRNYSDTYTPPPTLEIRLSPSDERTMSHHHDPLLHKPTLESQRFEEIDQLAKYDAEGNPPPSRRAVSISTIAYLVGRAHQAGALNEFKTNFLNGKSGSSGEPPSTRRLVVAKANMTATEHGEVAEATILNHLVAQGMGLRAGGPLSGPFYAYHNIMADLDHAYEALRARHQTGAPHDGSSAFYIGFTDEWFAGPAFPELEHFKPFSFRIAAWQPDLLRCTLAAEGIMHLEVCDVKMTVPWMVQLMAYHEAFQKLLRGAIELSARNTGKGGIRVAMSPRVHVYLSHDSSSPFYRDLSANVTATGGKLDNGQTICPPLHQLICYEIPRNWLHLATPQEWQDYGNDKQHYRELERVENYMTDPPRSESSGTAPSRSVARGVRSAFAGGRQWLRRRATREE